MKYFSLYKTTFQIVFLAFTSLIIQAQTLEWDYGRNDYEIPFEEVDRHFIIHVPESYTGDEQIPIVFMFHGTSAQGHKFWLDSKWKELAEVENFIAVFPSSWKYPILPEETIKD